MNPTLNRKPFVEALFDVMNVGMAHHCLDDAECVLNAVRALRPAVREFDTFEANIAMKRGQWQKAIHILHNVEALAPHWLPAKAALMQCLHTVGDKAWRVVGNEILTMAPHSEEADLARLAMGLPVESGSSPAAEEKPHVHLPLPHVFYVRA